VQNFLRSGDFLFGNPASLHSTGKEAKKFINQTSSFLFSTFNLNSKEFDLIYTSGATEAINSVYKGNALEDFKNKNKSLFVFSSVDHQAVLSLQADLELLGHEVLIFDVDRNGEFDENLLINIINKKAVNFFHVYLNFTYINNETGVVWPLDIASRIKAATNAYVYVDAVQLVGKIVNWQNISNLLDGYFFSAHKFGALKGVGFTFIKKDSPYRALITGGSQQDNRRAGTENALGIYSVKLALEEVLAEQNVDELLNAKNIIEKNIELLLNGRGVIVGKSAKFRNANTIFFVIFGEKAELLSMKFDMHNMDVSTGSACSSGIIKENRVLLSMGYSKEDSRAAIRLSFSPFLNSSMVKSYTEQINSVIGR
jgi:cysteine desulfurase